MSAYSGRDDVGQHWKRPLPVRCQPHEDSEVVEEGGDHPPDTVHHRPVGYDEDPSVFHPSVLIDGLVVVLVLPLHGLEPC